MSAPGGRGHCKGLTILVTIELYQDKRLNPRNAAGSSVFPFRAKSASICPITLANLNPCPLKPAAIITFSCRGK